MPDALYKYDDVSNLPKDAVLPPNRVTDHAINIQDGKEPPYSPLYALSELPVLLEHRSSLYLRRIAPSAFASTTERLTPSL
ncbi:hypothetical protein M433DRAFT_9657 [Acidomyces richmondensis BFW]|nr:hypothetical protein M433DRAFT_9657 [Acidomyces richmondensis BFW]